MRNSISKAVAKLAAAALVVAGGAGMGWAQLPSGEPDATVEMKATYTVETLAEIYAVPNDALDNEVLLTTEAATSTSAIGSTRGEGPGTLGVIRVKTNSTNWDVKMRTQSGGRLVDASGATTKPGKCGTWDDWGVVCTAYDPDTIVGGQYLTYSTKGSTTGSGIKGGATGTDADTVLLEVAVGVGNLGAVLSSGANATSVYALGAPSAPIEPVPVAHTALLASDVAPGATGAISLAATIAASSSNYGNHATILSFSNRLWASIVTNGFAAPNYTDDFSTPTPTVLTHKNEEYFFINVGLNQTLKDKLGGNKGGDYSETFFFDLVANF